MRKDLEAILKAAIPKGLDEPAQAFFESGLEKGYQIGHAEGFDEGRSEGIRVWSEAQAAAAENEKAGKAKA